MLVLRKLEDSDDEYELHDIEFKEEDYEDEDFVVAVINTASKILVFACCIFFLIELFHFL
jgi:hypothetical protein